MFCDADDVVSPHLISIVNRAIQIHNNPDFLIYELFTEKLPKSGWPFYDADNMKITDAEIFDGEELSFKIFSNSNIQGFLPTKILKRKFAQSVKLDEELRYCEDEHYLMNILAQNQNVKVCYVKCKLYCYVYHKEISLTQYKPNLYTKGGLFRMLEACEKTLMIDGIYPNVKDCIKGEIYNRALRNLFHNRKNLSPYIMQKVKNYMRFYPKYYYFNPNVPFGKKLKKFIEHIVTILHISIP